MTDKKCILFSEAIKEINPLVYSLESKKKCLIFFICQPYILVIHLPHMPILGSSNSAANKDVISKILTNGDTVFWWSRKPCGKRRNCSLRAISSFPTMFSNAVCC